MKERCERITKESLPDLGVSLHKIFGLEIKDTDSQAKSFNGPVYLMPAFVPYGHALMDCYSQFHLIKARIPELRPVFYNLSSRGWIAESYPFKSVIYDLMSDCGASEIVDLSKDDLIFDEVVFMFDYTNSLSKEFYEAYGIDEYPHYPKFCSCYLGSEECGKSESFKYNFAALDFLNTRFDSHKQPKDGLKIYVSRQGVNPDYQATIEALAVKTELTVEEQSILYRACVRYYPYEDQLEEHFALKGYQVVRPDGMGLFEQVSLFSRASHIAGLAGVGLFNMFWADHPTVYEIGVNAGYFYHHKTFGEYLGANYKKIEAYHSDPRLVIEAIEKAII